MTSPDPTPAWPRQSSLSIGLRCRCPRCGQGALFKGFISLREGCPSCGLDYGFADPADGPAFFVMTGVGCAIMALMAWIEVAYHPPIWFHFVFTLPGFILGCLATLRPVKAWLVAEQYLHKAEEAQFESVGKHGEGSRWR